MTLLIIIAVLALFTLGGAFVFQWAWAMVAVPLFHMPELTYWQAFAAMVLINIVGSAFRSASKGK